MSTDTSSQRSVEWLWDGRISLGSLSLLAGRCVGKTTCALTIAADITTGSLPGVYLGVPRSVIVVATEDSLADTIVPRLMAANADLSRVFLLKIADTGDQTGPPSFPRDAGKLLDTIKRVDAALVVLDPLLSCVDTDIDTDEAVAVQRFLGSILSVATETRVAVLGTMHTTGAPSSPLGRLSGSSVFVAAARSVLFAVVDPEDTTAFLLGQVKNDFGPALPTLRYRIVGTEVAQTGEGPIVTAQIEWLGTTSRTVADVPVS